MKRPLLFAELCAGTAAVSLKLEGGRHARPPVSRLGAKTGYGEALLKVMGLRCGLGAERYLWCDPDPGVRLLLEAYRDHDLALAAAEIIRGWKDEEPRALWERLKAEGPVRAPEPREVARWCLLGSWSCNNPEAHNSGTGCRWAGPGRKHAGGESSAVSLRALAERFSATLPADIHPDATQIDPREVARWVYDLANRVYGDGGFAQQKNGSPGNRWPTHTRCAEDLSSAPTLSAFILPAAVYPMPRFPEDERVIAYMDPPYSDVPSVIPPMLAAERLPLGAIGSTEGEAALLACDLDCLREPVRHLRVAVLEVLRSAGVQSQVLDSIVERIVIDVVDDLVWSQFAADVPFHHKSVLRSDSSIVTTESVPVAFPPLAIIHPTSGGELLPLRRHLRDFALSVQSLPGAAAKFPQAVAWADSALACCDRVPSSRKLCSADLAGDLKRHRVLRFKVRQDINTKLHTQGRKTTGYGHDLPRAEVVRLARAWADAGADVYISEAEPIGALVEDGWHVVEITSTRKGQKRTFGGTQEWLTCSREPAWTPGATRQAHLFGVPEPDTGRR